MGILAKLKKDNTPLRSLPFGNDKPGGGNSNAPYIQTPIPNVTGTNFGLDSEDSILRGGLKTPSRAKDDVVRLTKYLFDVKNIDGYLFIAKQNILSRISPKTESTFGLGYGGASQNINIFSGEITPNQSNGSFNEGVYTPISTLIQAGIGFTGTHVNKQGIDPTGLIPTLSLNKYQEVAYKNNLPDNNGYSGQVPLSLYNRSRKATDKKNKTFQQFTTQQDKTNQTLSSNPERRELFTTRNSINVFKTIGGNAGVKGALFLENQRSLLFEKWDKYIDNLSQKRLDKKYDAFVQASNRDNELYKEVVNEAQTIRYDNRLLQLWTDIGYNPLSEGLNSPFLYSYGGGPGSVSGLGRTDIKFATKNDGVTPLRTDDGLFYDSKKYTKSIYYDTKNIFGYDSVSLNYSKTLEQAGRNINEIDLFSTTNYLESYDGKNDIDAPWNTQGIKLIDSLRPTPEGPEVSFYQKAFALSDANNNNPLIPHTQNTILNVRVRGPLGASVQYLKSYGTLDNALELDKKVFIVEDENPYHQAWAAQDPTTFAPLANKAYEQDNPYIESTYSEDLTLDQATIDLKSDLLFKLNNSQFDFTKYAGVTSTWENNRGSIYEKNPFESPSINIPEPNLAVTSGNYTTPFRITDPVLPSSYLFSTSTPTPKINYGVYEGATLMFITNKSTSLKGSKYGIEEQKPIQPIDNSYPDPDTVPIKLSRAQIKQKIDDSYYNLFDDNNPHPSFSKTRKEETNRNPNRFPKIAHEDRVNTGDPAKSIPGPFNVLDKINSKSVYKSSGNGAGRQLMNDFVHFRIGIVDVKSGGKSAYYMNFRSYIDSFSDSFTSNWKDLKYMGRGEPFKRYSDFSRTINMSFTIAATSQGEMYGIYDKLRLLATSIAPSYTDAGYMAGNFAKLTVGGYVYEQYGIITGFTYEIPQEASWDLTIGDGAFIRDELPMMIKVTGFTFVPVYNFIPQFTDADGFRWISNNIPSSTSLLTSNEIESEDKDKLQEGELKIGLESSTPGATDFSALNGTNNNDTNININNNPTLSPAAAANDPLIGDPGNEVIGLDLTDSFFNNNF